MNTIPHPELPPKGNAMQTEYKGIAITYNETENRFEFDLRGRQRWAVSLAAAKAKIDEPAKEKAFQRCKAYYKEWGWGEAWVIVEVTSINQDGEAWINNRGSREKTRAHSLYSISPANDTLIARINECEAQAAKLAKDVEKLEEKLEEKLSVLQ